ncbi:MAG: cysteine-rich small domain-containing protein [Porcipelethomonas sp.]
MDNYKFFINEKCEFFPCHKNISPDDFNCLFCYCPLYTLDCGGNYKILENGIKDCSGCNIPHKKENYDFIIQKLMNL